MFFHTIASVSLGRTGLIRHGEFENVMRDGAPRLAVIRPHAGNARIHCKYLLTAFGGAVGTGIAALLINDYLPASNALGGTCVRADSQSRCLRI
jgi:hypothetical protein